MVQREFGGSVRESAKEFAIASVGDRRCVGAERPDWSLPGLCPSDLFKGRCVLMGAKCLPVQRVYVGESNALMKYYCRERQAHRAIATVYVFFDIGRIGAADGSAFKNTYNVHASWAPGLRGAAS